MQRERGRIGLDALIPHSASHVRVKGDRNKFQDDLIFVEFGIEVDCGGLIELESVKGRLALGEFVEDEARVGDGRHDVEENRVSSIKRIVMGYMLCSKLLLGKHQSASRSRLTDWTYIYLLESTSLDFLRNSFSPSIQKR